MRRLLFAFCASLLALPGCHKADPTNIEDQVEILKAKHPTKEKEKAVANLRAIGKREAVPGMIEAFKVVNSRIKEDLAVVFGELKDPAAVPALIEGIDMAVGDGADRATKEANATNEKIARALGDIGDKSAVKPLMQLLKVTRNNYVKVEALGALGRLKDPAAVPLLSKLAMDDLEETLINKKALQALTNINHPDALPVYMQMAFVERRGVSFYPESAYGIFMLGPVAQDRVLALVSGKDAEMIELAKKREIVTPALYAKAAQMESDLQDKRAIPALLTLLKFDDSEPDRKFIVRAQAADALGRMRAKEAVGPLTAMLKEEDEGARSAYMRALAQIGDPAALPKFIECSRLGVWGAREYCLIGVVHLGGAKEIAFFDAILKEEPGRFDKECKSGVYGDVDCKGLRAENVKLRGDSIQNYKKAMQAIGACSDNACFEKLLDHAEPLVRERAAYELARRSSAGSIGALMTAIKRPVSDKVDLNPRFAVICALDWIAQSSPQALAAAKAQVNAIEAQVEEDSKKMLTQRIAEEEKRLAAKLSR